MTGTARKDDARDGATGPDRRRLLLGAGLAVALLLGAWTFLLPGSAQDDLGAFAGATPRSAVAAPAPEPGGTTLPPPMQQRQGRNPFRVLYTPPTSNPSGAAPRRNAPATAAPATEVVTTEDRATTGDTTTTGDGTRPAAGTAPVPLWLEMDGGATGLDAAERARHLADGTWTFRVGSSRNGPDVKDYVVAPEQDFASYFRLLRLTFDDEKQRQCAQVQFGDDTLSLCEADSRDLER